MTPRPISLLLLLALPLGACRSTPRPPAAAVAVDSTTLARAKAAANDLGADLMGMLTRQLAQSGPGAAVAVCADSAQARTAQHQKEGVMVRRVGTRIRNPLNTPDSLEAAVLQAFQAALAASRLPADTAFVETVAGGSAVLHYLRPIRVQQPCLTCHGPAEGIAPAVRQVLAERYPDDAATGYAVGDLRGAISVSLPMGTTAAR